MDLREKGGGRERKAEEEREEEEGVLIQNDFAKPIALGFSC